MGTTVTKAYYRVTCSADWGAEARPTSFPRNPYVSGGEPFVETFVFEPLPN
jgi:hypothetical protein